MGVAGWTTVSARMVEVAVLTMILTSNTTARLCNNGQIASTKCDLIFPPNNYSCTMDPKNYDCEKVNGSFFCCGRPMTAVSGYIGSAPPPSSMESSKCRDSSHFCSFLTSFCTNPNHRQMMIKDCSRTCGFCEDKKNGLKSLNGTRRSPGKIAALENARIAEALLANEEDERELHRQRQMVSPQRRTNSDVPYLSEEIFGNEIFPEIVTAEPDDLPISLKKTVIRGSKSTRTRFTENFELWANNFRKCFDEYMYCREFVSLCTHPTLSYAMAKRCALTCDRCEDVTMNELEHLERRNCTDASPGCNQYAFLCSNDRYNELLSHHCAKTCRFCLPICRDRHKNCEQYKNDGFCHDGMYSKEERKFLCGFTCRMCEFDEM